MYIVLITMKLVTLFLVLFCFLLKVNGQQNDGLDLSKVLDTLYNKVEANMIKTIRKNLGGKNSIIKPKEKVNCKKPKFALNPKCIKKNLAKRMKRIENTVKKIKVQSKKNNLKDLNLYKKKVDALITNFTQASISSNITDKLNSASDKENKLENLVNALN